MAFIIILNGGKRLPFTVVAPDADVAVYRAKRQLGIRNISHAIPA